MARRKTFSKTAYEPEELDETLELDSQDPEESSAEESELPMVFDAPEAPVPAKSATITYDGSASDTAVTPEVLMIGHGGRPIKRRVLKAAKLERFPIDTYKLWGLEFPKGEAVEVSTSYFSTMTVTLRDLVLKAKALGCFAIDCAPELLEPPPARARLARRAQRAR